MKNIRKLVKKVLEENRETLQSLKDHEQGYKRISIKKISKWFENKYK